MGYTIDMLYVTIFLSIFFSIYFWQVFVPFVQRKYRNWRYEAYSRGAEQIWKVRQGDLWAVAAHLKGTSAWTNPSLSDLIDLYADRLARWIEKKRGLRR